MMPGDKAGHETINFMLVVTHQPRQDTEHFFNELA